jgi:Common central domain of tyrosinase
MKPEEQLLREYFGDPKGEHKEEEIMKAAPMKDHMDWHMRHENMIRTGNYGERFLLFHKEYVEKFGAFRISKGFLRTSSWDPSTEIPSRYAHEVHLTAGRDTDNPSSVNHLCKTPTWLTFSGGTNPDPVYGHTSLWQFRSLEELGRAIDNSWHIEVHNTIGGDMSQFHSPIDPIFWPWHKWIDEIRAKWATWNAGLIFINPRAIDISRWFVRAGMGEDIPFPSSISKSTIEAFLALEVNEISYQISDPKSRESLRRTAANLLNNVIHHITAQSDSNEPIPKSSKTRIRVKRTGPI